jgi:hypothetical protein
MSQVTSGSVGKEVSKMIIMAIMAPVMIMAVMAIGAATMAVVVVSVATVGGVVVGATDRAYYAVTRKRARRREVPDNVVAWPRPTAGPASADGGPAGAGQAVPERWAAVAAAGSAPVAVSRAPVSEQEWEQVVGFDPWPWDDVFPFEEPDFEKVVTYTLVAGSDF